MIARDIADNISQLSKWLRSPSNERKREIDLYLKLTRKDIEALSDHELPETLRPMIRKFRRLFDKLEAEYRDGITNHDSWEEAVHMLITDLSKHTLRA